MRSIAFTILPLLSTLAVACGDPCIPQTIGDPSQIDSVIAAQCHADDSTSAESTGNSSGGETGASETTSPTASSDGSSSGGELPDLICATSPPAGTPWGPCKPDGTCDKGPNDDAVFCYHSDTGSLCMPPCTDDGPDCSTPLCSGGTCRADGACIMACNTDADCPLAVFVCDTSAPVPTCVHPG